MPALMFEVLHRLVIPDKWQAEAISFLRQGWDVILDAPTGAGKTYVLEKFVESANLARQVIYTVPTRALANDKFAEWRARGFRCGITTGDLTLEPEAPLLVATLEAVQGVAYETSRAVGLFVVDEYQWISHPQRGNHYEGALLSMPPDVQLLLMSGSIANPEDVSAWLERLGRRVKVVRHRDRPVPLEEVDVDSLERLAPRTVQGFWPRRIAGALREDLGPILVFAPHRADAERLARQCARELPLIDPMPLSTEQEKLLGSELARMVRARIAYHHSGLSYSQRAGVIEPLAKSGQLRVVVATLGLSAGINFSLRSVLITANRFTFEHAERYIEPHELLQMIGRAGRRGLDETGYYLVSENSPRLSEARPLRLKRAAPLPWASFLRTAEREGGLLQVAQRFSTALFNPQPIKLGVEHTPPDLVARIPCHNPTDTGRARLVRRTRRPFKPCRTCPERPACLALDPQATLLYQWRRIRLLDQELKLTERGRIVSFFLGPEGLALAAALEDPTYAIPDLLMDAANLFGGDRFSHNDSRWSGRLAMVCQRAYDRLSIEGFLQDGVPPHYGAGAADLLRNILTGDRRRGQVTGDAVGRGDVDRLFTEWYSLLRQIGAAPHLEQPRWLELQRTARDLLKGHRQDESVLTLPPLLAEQRRPVSHRLRWK